MKPLAVRIVFEHGPDGIAYSPAEIRLIRPLTHPAMRDCVRVESAPDYAGQASDVVVVDRTWRPDLSLALARDLVAKIRRSGARFLYAIDDDFFELQHERKDWAPTAQLLDAIDFFARNADAVVVTTKTLRERLAGRARRIVVIPNMLDERLLGKSRWKSWFGWRSTLTRAAGAPIVIGYMGTYTHDDDLHFILPALENVCTRHPGLIRIEIVGVMARTETRNALSRLPWSGRHPAQGHAYPAFVKWFTTTTAWDIAVAPLQDTAFNRCKSDIKFLDYAAITAAGIFSKCPAYVDSVRHRQTGLLVDNSVEAWTDALDLLVRDEVLRRSIGENARQYLFRERTVARIRPVWQETLDYLML